MIYKITGSTEEGNRCLISKSNVRKHDDFMFNTKNSREEWKAPMLSWDEDSSMGKINDVIFVYSAGIEIIINESTKNIIEKSYKGYFSFIDAEFSIDEIKYYYLNVKNIIENVLDEKKSDYLELSNGKKALISPVFLDCNTPENQPFLISQIYSGFYIKGNEFKELVKNNNITGFNIEET